MRIIDPFAVPRRTVLLGATAAMLAANAPSGRVPRVLFVCAHGTVKSPIARELLISRARERGIAVAVRSRGIDPEAGASVQTAIALERDGIDTARQPTVRLGDSDFAWADMVVAFDRLPQPGAAHDLRDWSDTPSVNDSYAAAMAAINRRLDALLDELARCSKGKRL